MWRKFRVVCARLCVGRLELGMEKCWPPKTCAAAPMAKGAVGAYTPGDLSDTQFFGGLVNGQSDTGKLYARLMPGICPSSKRFRGAHTFTGIVGLSVGWGTDPHKQDPQPLQIGSQRPL